MMRAMSKRTIRLVTGLAAGVIVIGSLACAPTVVPPEKRTFHDAEDRFSYVVPPNWVVWMGEARSPRGSLFSIEPVSLEDSADDFVRGLPGSMVPLVKEQTGRFFSVVGNAVEKKATVGGLGALQVSFPVRIRAVDPESQVTFWLARHGKYAFVMRVSYPAGSAADDSPAVDSIIASWKWTPLPTPEPGTTPGKLVSQVPPENWTPIPR
jgi:hypothetical protein